MASNKSILEERDYHSQIKPGFRLAVTKTVLIVLLLAVSLSIMISCQSNPKTTVPSGPPTLNEVAGTWKSHNSFYLILDDRDQSFSFADTARTAEAKNGPHGTFSLIGNEIYLKESADSEVCANMEASFQIEITSAGNLRLTIIEDPCIYRVEGVFQGGQGGNKFLDFRPVR